VSLRLDNSTPAMNDGAVPAGTYKVGLVDPVNLNNVIGQIDVVAEVQPNFYGSAPPRIGWGALGSWLIALHTAIVLNRPWIFTVFTACLLNTIVSPTSPVTIEQLNQLNQVIATTLITAITCVNIQILAATYRLRIRGTGMGSSADMNGFGGTGAPSLPIIRRP
jgi:hypothetical protein